MTGPEPSVRVGTAGWSIPRAVAASFPGEGSHLERFARVLGCAEINSSFHRSHSVEVYAKWAAQTPETFRFAAKLPRTITHEGALMRAREPLQRFVDEASGLGPKLAVLLVQLPPSLQFDRRRAGNFFRLATGLFGGAIVCEPRHASWFTPEANRLLVAARVGRVAADPARWPEAARPGGWLGPEGDGAGALLYHRWHGSPRTYWSSYDERWLRERDDERRAGSAHADAWYVFDNTAAGAAAPNALALQALSLTPG